MRIAQWQQTRLGRLAPTIVPLLLVASVMVLLAIIHYHFQGFGKYPGIVGFAEISQGDARRLGIPELAIGNNTGYDGQFFYYLAARPSIITTCPHDPATCPAYEPAFRWQRIFYPMTARVLALGQTGLIPYTLLFANFVGVLVTALLIGRMCVEAGASRWMGAAAALFCGELLGFLRDLADPFGVLWIVVAIYLLRHNKTLWAAAAVAAALLTREQLVFYLPMLSIPLLVQRRWLTLAQSAAIALGPFIVWQLILHSLYGVWPLLAGDTHAAKLVSVPFGGLWETRHDFDFSVTLLCAAVPLVASVVVAITAIWWHGPRRLLEDPLPLMVLFYCVLFSFVGSPQWADVWGAGRIEAPGVVLAVLVAATLPRTAWRAAFAALLSVTAFAPLIEFVR